LVVDDHTIVRTCIAKILSGTPNIRVVGEAKSGEEAISLLKHSNPNLILMDLKMPGMGGIEACKQIIAISPDVNIVILTSIYDVPFIIQTLKIGVAGYVIKGADISELITAIKTVYSGQRYISLQIAQIMATASIPLGTKDQLLKLLSARELQVMQMLTRGQKTNDIANTLGLSPKTISAYRARILDKLKLSSDVELTHIAVNYGLIE
jgi:two-component system invasion response regulator UvrY